MAITLEQLTRLCAPPDAWCDWQKRPFVYDEHTIATDGNMLLAVQRRTEGAATNAPESQLRAIGRLLAGSPPASATTTTVEALRAWAGDGRIVCSICGGAGYHEGAAPCTADGCEGGVVYGTCDCCGQDTEVDCSKCGGRGTIKVDGKVPCQACGGSGESRKYGEPTPERVGRIGRAFIDTRRIANLLAGLSGPCRVWQGEQRYDPVRISGDGWEALLMPVRGATAHMPAFDSAVGG